MDAADFVDIVKQVVRDSAVQDTLSVLERPPGRRPPADLVDQSNWFIGLDKEQRKIVEGIVRTAVDYAVFGFLTVLDGVRAVESTPEKGTFELRFSKGGVENVISPSDIYLYELF